MSQNERAPHERAAAGDEGQPAVPGPAPPPGRSESTHRSGKDAIALQAAMRASPLGIAVLDPAGIVTAWNGAAEEIFGWRAEEVIGKPLPIFHPPDAASGRDLIRHAAEGHAVAHEEIGCLTQRGSPIYTRVSAVPARDAQGQVRSVVTFWDDVTERRQMKEGLYRLATESRAILWAAEVRERDGRYYWYLNVSDIDAAQAVVALDVPPGQTYAQAWYASRHPEDRARSDEVGVEALSSGRGFYSQEFRCINREGRLQWLSERVTLNPVGTGLWRAIGICIDITERKQAEAEQALALEALRDSEARRKRTEEALNRTWEIESLGLFVGRIAHDCKNYLAAVLGQATLALAQLSPADAAQPHVLKAAQAAERAAALVRQLLDDPGGTQTERLPLDLNRLIDEYSGLLDTLVPGTVRPEVRLSPALPPIEGDAGRIRHIVMNLVVNAAEAMPPAGGRITIATRAQEDISPLDAARAIGFDPAPARRYVVLEVADTGHGMDSATLARIFDPLFTTKPSGHGMGLSAAQSIVRDHGGGMRVTSEPGLGTAFTLLFPALADSSSEGAPPYLTAEPAPPDDPWRAMELPDAQVLVIDDEAMVREAVADILIAAGLRVLEAEGGQEGIALYQRRGEEIDLVLLDLQMPEMDGEETLRRLREIDPNVRVIVSSGYAEASAAGAGRSGPGSSGSGRLGSGRLGAGVAFLQKPYPPQQLLETVRDLLRADES